MKRNVIICDMCRIDREVNGEEVTMQEIVGKAYSAELTGNHQGVEKAIYIDLCEDHFSRFFPLSL
jgi:hypothetical protein